MLEFGDAHVIPVLQQTLPQGIVSGGSQQIPCSGPSPQSAIAVGLQTSFPWQQLSPQGFPTPLGHPFP
jgi:hypothetical protein